VRRLATCSLLKFLQDADDEPWAGDFIHATLRLCRALAKRNRSDDGMLALYVSLHNVEATDPNPKRRWAARLILAHTLAADAADFEPFQNVGIDTSVEYNCGVASFNAAITDSGSEFLETLVAVMGLWHWLLPEVSADSGLIQAAAADLDRSES
jgi:hypothetical protein